MDAFRHQSEANAYIASIESDYERVFLQAALARAIGFLVNDDDYKQRCMNEPFDFLVYARVLHALVMNRCLMTEIFSGKYADFAEIPDVF